MRWVLLLYPPAWRERYGEEMEALLEDQPPGPTALLDLVAGALDARRDPRWARRDPARKAALLRCALGSLDDLIVGLLIAGGLVAASWAVRHAQGPSPLGPSVLAVALLLGAVYGTARGRMRRHAVPASVLLGLGTLGASAIVADPVRVAHLLPVVGGASAAGLLGYLCKG